MSGEASLITLPRGILRGGTRQRAVRLRALSAEEQMALLDDPAFDARRVSALLRRVLSAPGDAPAGEEDVRALCVGDRDALLLHLRRAHLGDALPCVAACPACGEKAELDLRASDLLLPPYPDQPDLHELPLPTGGLARFRLPTGADLEAVAPLAERDPDAAARILLARCLTEPALDALSPESVVQLGEAMAALDPQADLDLAVACAACGRGFVAPFDASRFVLSELAAQARALLEEVHALALAYHWREAEILAMPPARRRLYLQLLDHAGRRPA